MDSGATQATDERSGGCHLYADNTGRPGLTVIRLGAPDDLSGIEPTANIWAGSAPRRACFNAALDRFDGQPQPLSQAPAKAR